MRNLLLTALVLFSSAALGQTAQSTLQFANSTDTVRFGPGDCGGRSFLVTWRASGRICSELSLWLTSDASCKDTPDDQTTKTTLSPLPTTTLATGTGNFSFQLTDLPFSSSDGGVACGTTGVEQTFLLCGSLKASSDTLYGSCTTTTVSRSTGAKVIYDAKPPDTPTISGLSGLDQAVSATVSEPTGAATVRLRISRDGTEVRSVSQAVGKGAFRVEGLENGVTYQVTAFASDEAGNESAESAAQDVTPIKTRGFLEVYRDAGGTETGGCGAAGGGVAGGAVLAALGFWLFSRRNRSWHEQ